MRRQKQAHKPRVERQNEIILAAFGQRVNGRKTFTNAAVARWLGLSVSSRLKGMIDDLVDEGWMTKNIKEHRNSLMKDGNRLVIVKHEYALSPFALEQMALL